MEASVAGETIIKETIGSPNSLSEESFVVMGEAEYESLPTNKLSVHMLAGAAAGVAEHCIVYPVDCVKTRMMNIEASNQYRGVFKSFMTIAKSESPQTLFRGIGVVATGAGPAHALYFSCYEFTKRSLSGNNRSNVLTQGCSAIMATLFHDGLMNPVDVIKQRLQMHGSPYNGAFECARKVFATEGISAFYRSYTTQLTMNIPFQVLHFVSYEFLQELLNPTHQYDPKSHVISGALAGAIAASATTPFDVAKTLLNTMQQEKSISRDEKVHGITKSLRVIFKHGGMHGYFRGVSARVIYQMPSTAICWSVYEFFKYILGYHDTAHSS